jgi:hypothetical protein
LIGKIFPRTIANPSSPLSAWTKPKSVAPIRVSFSFLTHKQVSNTCKIYLWTFNKYSRHLRFVFLEKNACVQCIKLNFIFDNKIQMTFLLIANCWYYWHNESSLLPILLPLPISEPKHQPIAIPQIYEFFFFKNKKSQFFLWLWLVWVVIFMDFWIHQIFIFMKFLVAVLNYSSNLVPI